MTFESQGYEGSSANVSQIAESIVEQLAKSGLLTRIFGGAGILLTTQFEEVLGSIRVTRDIDIVSAKADHRHVWEWLVAAGWTPDQYETFRGKSLKSTLSYGAVKVDLYSDPLYFSQRLDLQKRLSLKGPVLSPVDLLLTKLQAEAFTLTDLKDVLAILGTWSVSSNDKEGINAERFSEACAHSWGLYHSCTTKLIIIAGLGKSNYSLQTKFDASIRQCALELLGAARGAPKSLHWRIRDWIGPRLKWYADVD